MKCKECKHYTKLNDGHGICKYTYSYFPSEDDNNCKFLPENQELHCADCERLGNDTACFTARGDDPVNRCGGFIDLREE